MAAAESNKHPHQPVSLLLSSVVSKDKGGKGRGGREVPQPRGGVGWELLHQGPSSELPFMGRF